jgi:hypothetical protein
LLFEFGESSLGGAAEAIAAGAHLAYGRVAARFLKRADLVHLGFEFLVCSFVYHGDKVSGCCLNVKFYYTVFLLFVGYAIFTGAGPNVAHAFQQSFDGPLVNGVRGLAGVVRQVGKPGLEHYPITVVGAGLAPSVLDSGVCFELVQRPHSGRPFIVELSNFKFDSVKPDDNVSRVEVYVLESTAFADGYFARFSSHKPMVVFRFHTQNLAECLNSVKINLQLYSAVHHGVAKDKNKTVSNL